MIRAILSLFFITAFSQNSHADDSLSGVERTYYLNESVEICQPPTEMIHLPSVRGDPYFLKYNNSENAETYLTIVIWGRDIPNLEIDPSSYFSSSNMCIKGTVSDYKGQRQVVVRDLNQLVKK
jgi:hypothetical protein